MALYKIDTQNSSVGYGKIAVNESGADFPIVAEKNNDDLIFAHAPSILYIDVEKEIKIKGGLNGDANPFSSCDFYINGDLVGTLSPLDDETEVYSVKPGRREFEITTRNGANAHTYWRIINGGGAKASAPTPEPIVEQEKEPDEEPIKQTTTTRKGRKRSV